MISQKTALKALSFLENIVYKETDEARHEYETVYKYISQQEQCIKELEKALAIYKQILIETIKDINEAESLILDLKSANALSVVRFLDSKINEALRE